MSASKPVETTPVRKLIRSARPDGRFHTTAGLIHHRLKQLHPRLEFPASCTRPQLEQWKKKVRQRLRVLLHLPRVTGQPAPRLISDEPRSGYRLQRWEMFPEPDSVVPMVMLVPDGVTARNPGATVICLPGSDHPNDVLTGEPDRPGATPNKFAEHNAMALQLVRAGFVALCIENPGTGSLLDPIVTDWRRQASELMWLGGSYEALSVFHKLTALKWLKRLPIVDRHRIAACGHSLGSKPALHLGLLDPSLRAVVWNSGAHDFRLRHVVMNLTPIAPWQYIPGFIQWFDNLDLMAALAPTPLLITEGGRADRLRRVRRAYALAGAPRNVVVSYTPSYREASTRTQDRRPMPEGLTDEEHGVYNSATNAEHYFHGDVAVPWLRRVLA